MSLHLRGIADDNPPTIRRLHNLHANAVRMVARQQLGDSFSYRYRLLLSAGIATIPVLTSDSFLTDNYAAETKLYVYRCPTVPFWIVGNEWNMTPPGNASWPLDPEDLIALWNEVAPQLPPGTRFLGGFFMVDGAPSLLHGVLWRLTPRPDGVCLHPYLDTTPTFEETVTFLQEAGYQVAVDEWNDSHARSLQAFQRTMDAMDVVASCFLPWKTSPAVDDLPGLCSPVTDRLTALGLAYRSVLTGG